MLSLMFLGSSLLVANHLLNWSRRTFVTYEDLLSEKHEIEDQCRAWQEKLNEIETPAHDEINTADTNGDGGSANNAPLPPPQQQQQQPQQQSDVPAEPAAAQSNTSLNGKSGNLNPASTALGLILAAVVAIGSTACESYKVQHSDFRKIEIPYSNQFNIVSDDSGICNKIAYKEAARNLIKAMPKIVKKHKIGNVAFYQFNDNARNARLTKDLAFPASIKYELLPVEAKSELEKIRPDVVRKKESERQKALLSVNGDAENENEKRIDDVLKPVSAEEMVPLGESDKTDLNGALIRFGQPSSANQEISAFLSDGHQNLDTREIASITPSKNNVAIVFILIPESDSSDIADYEETKARIQRACPWAIVVPHYQKDLDKIVDEAVRKSQEFTASSN
jgi:hypothetical protein